MSWEYIPWDSRWEEMEECGHMCMCVCVCLCVCVRTSTGVVHEDLLHSTVIVHLCLLLLSGLACRVQGGEGRGVEGRGACWSA